jgi:5-carboxymethyl-2-hydroxymuconate isomerase
MPHLTLEYSANLAEPDLAGLFAALHEAVATLGFAVDDCKTRAYRCESYRVGTGAPERGFAHLTLAVLDHRTPETQRQLARNALRTLQLAFDATALDCDLTVEVREMRSGSYFKTRGPNDPAGRA